MAAGSESTLATHAAAAAEDASRAVIARFSRFAALPARDRADLADAIRRGVLSQLDPQHGQTYFRQHDLALFDDLTGRLVRHGVPMLEFVAFQEAVGAAVAAAVWQSADPEWLPRLAPMMDRAMENHHKATIGSIRRFMAESARARIPLSVPAVLAEAILSGQMNPHLAEATNLIIPEKGYVVTAVPVPATNTRLGTVTAGSRGLDVLCGADGQDMVVLAAIGPDGEAEARARTTRLLRVMRPGTGSTVVGVRTSLAGVPSAVRRSRDLRALAMSANLPDPLCAPDALLVDLCAARDVETVRGLADLLSTLRPELVHTLRVFYSLDLRRGETAAVLGVHRQTLTYRLNRVSELTGLDPVSVPGLVVLSTALTVVSDIRHRESA